MYNERYDAHLDYNNFKQWDLTKCVSPEHYDDFMELLNNRALWDSLEPPPYCQEVLRLLKQSGYTILFATATDYRNFGWKCEWMREHFDIDPNTDIIRITNKSLLTADLIFDDNPQHVQSRVIWNRVILTKPWNVSWDEREFAARRVTDWLEFYDAVSDIYQIESRW